MEAFPKTYQKQLLIYLSCRKKCLRKLFVSWAVMKDIKVADGFSQGLSKPLKPQSQISRSFNLNGVNPVITMMSGDVSPREIDFLYSWNEENTFSSAFFYSSSKVVGEIKQCKKKTS